MSNKIVISKSTFLATIVALAVASISASSVFAASPGRLTTAHQRQVDEALQSDWKAATLSLRMEKFQNTLLQKWAEMWLKDNPNSLDRVKVENYLHKADLLIVQAEAAASKHTGFNESGTVLDSVVANKTLEQFTADLHAILIDNLDSFLQ